MLTKLFGYTEERDQLLDASHRPTADTAAVITLAASSGFHHVIHGVQWSYTGTAPSSGKLTITVNAAIKWEVDITALGPGGFTFTIAGGNNQAVVLTLAAGGAATTGKLNAQYTTEATNSK